MPIQSIDFTPDCLKGLLKSYKLYRSPETLVGPTDDDCGVISLPNGYLVASTDFVNAWPAILELKIGSFADYGALLANANFSDLLGSGASPIAILVAVGLPRSHCNPETFKEIMDGINQACKDAGATLLGGDTKGSQSLSCSATAIGYVPDKDCLRLSSGFSVGDAIVVSGILGDFNMAVLEASKDSAIYNENRQKFEKIIRRQALPFELANQLRQLRIQGGGTDISDGLGADLSKACISSGVGAVIDVSKIPVSRLCEKVAGNLGFPPWAYSLAGGGDWQFIFSVRQRDLRKIDTPHFVIGEVIKEKRLELQLNGNRVPLPDFGHSDFKFPSFASEIEHYLTRSAKLFT